MMKRPPSPAAAKGGTSARGGQDAVGGKRPAKFAARGRQAKTEVSAGGIVFKRTPQGVRLAFLLDPFGKWAFAKGHVEAGETVEAAALRETREEMGLGRLRVVAPLGKIDFWFRDRYRVESKGTLIHKYVHFFLMQAPSHAKGQPQKKEKIKKIIWVPIERIDRISGYKDVRPILKKVKEFFSRSTPKSERTPVSGRTGTTSESEVRSDFGDLKI